MKIVRRTPFQAYKLWIAALRSGEFVQGHGRLKRLLPFFDSREEYCCLGVLCELAHRDGGPAWTRPGESEVRPLFTNKSFAAFNGAAGYLPPPVSKFMKLAPWEEKTLVSMNDSGRASFTKIADHIERVIMPRIFGDPSSPQFAPRRRPNDHP